MKVVKFFGEVIIFRSLIKKEFVVVRDYFLVSILFENGLCFGLLEIVKVNRFYRIYKKVVFFGRRI